MIIFLVALFALSIWGLGIRHNNGDYLAKEQATSIRGIFALIIFFSHIKQYLVFERGIDLAYATILGYIGQLMVVIFFFYSGYGIALSFDKKKGYERGFIKNRIFQTYIHFATAVLTYYLLDLILGIYYPAKTILLSFIGWDSIGNSNWFVFDTLVLYFCTYICFMFAKLFRGKKKNVALAISVGIMTCVVIILIRFAKPSWWYDTLFGFPCGMVFYLLKNSIDKVWKTTRGYIFSGGILILTFLTTYLIGNAFTYNICACVFCVIICWFTNRIKVGNAALTWLGKYSFYIYIYMRIPMIILQYFGYDKNVYVFTLISLIVTLLIAGVFGTIQSKVDKTVFGERR